MPDSILEQLRKLKERERALRDDAKGELMSKYDALVDEFAELGIPFPGARKATKGGSGIKRALNPTKVCEICGFATRPKNHDSRSHRSQGKAKKMFTAAELKEKGWEKA